MIPSSMFLCRAQCYLGITSSMNACFYLALGYLQWRSIGLKPPSTTLPTILSTPLSTPISNIQLSTASQVEKISFPHYTPFR